MDIVPSMNFYKILFEEFVKLFLSLVSYLPCSFICPVFFICPVPLFDLFFYSPGTIHKLRYVRFVPLTHPLQIRINE